MVRQNSILLVCLGVVVLAVLAAPVMGGLEITDGATITSTMGSTSPVIKVTDNPIFDGGTIEIDVSSLRWDFRDDLTDANIEIQTTAASAVWTPSITNGGDTLTLTSSGGDTAVDDTITVTFKGVASEPWSPNIDDTFPVPVKRMDETYDPPPAPYFTFTILTPAADSGLTISDGATITSTTGETSPVITIANSPIPQDGNISIDVENLGIFTAALKLTDANVEVQSTAAAPVVWTRSVSPDGKTLNLTSTGGATAVDDIVTVTFTGAGNPWIPNTITVPLTTRRDDKSDTATINVELDIAPSGGLTIADGEKIDTTTGATSPVISITNAPVAPDGNITINIAGLNPYVVGGHLRTANVEVTDTAAAATWTCSVIGDTLNLTSTGGPTAPDEMITVTFTGAGGSPWVADTGAERIIPLVATRDDTLETGTFNFVIDTGGRPIIDFSATPRSAANPATITFTDLSGRSPIAWNWTFGDGTYSELQNPSHTYTTSGLYTINLNATNVRGWTRLSKADFIEVYNSAVRPANTEINGLTITNCGGPQTVIVDASILPAVLNNGNTVLEIQPPADRGFKSIIIYAQNGVGFSRTGDIISGSPTSVYLVSEDITPSPSFSPDIGINAAFNWTADLSSYPCNAVISTTIRERISPENEALIHRVAAGNSPPAILKGTAYTATITRTNFPSSVPINLHASTTPSWRTDLDPTSRVFIWRISDDRTQGQILPTNLVSGDLDYYEAASPLGMSTFGLSAFTGNNNPFQLVTLTVAAYIEPPNLGVPAVNEADQQVTPALTATPVPTRTAAPNATTSPPGLPGSVTAKIYANADGVITQTTTLASSDGFLTVSLGKGVIAKDKEGKPLSSISLTPIPAGSLPGALPEGAVTFAGRAYELQPDGAVFTPSILLSFAAPADARFNQEFSVKVFNHVSGTWKDVPTVYDTRTGQVTAQVSDFCCFALFARTITAEPTAAVTNIQEQPPEIQTAAVPPTAISTVAGLIKWVVNLLAQNSIIVVIVVIVVAGLVLYEWKQRRHW